MGDFIADSARSGLLHDCPVMLAVTLVAELEGYVRRGPSVSAPCSVLIRDRVTELQPIDTLDAPFYYTFKVQCTSCREIHPNWVNVSRFVS